VARDLATIGDVPWSTRPYPRPTVSWAATVGPRGPPGLGFARPPWPWRFRAA